MLATEGNFCASCDQMPAVYFVAILQTLTIVSGGQTGADRAALDFAIEHGIAHGGWCPRGRLAEDGPLPARYELRETPSRRYSQRTEWNVRDSDGTALFSITPDVRGGSALTLAVARRLGKPLLHVVRDSVASRTEVDALAASNSRSKFVDHADLLQAFLTEHSIGRLNVAGSRASQEPAVGEFVRGVLESLCWSDLAE
jgi:hypothetical protein